MQQMQEQQEQLKKQQQQQIQQRQYIEPDKFLSDLGEECLDVDDFDIKKESKLE